MSETEAIELKEENYLPSLSEVLQGEDGNELINVVAAISGKPKSSIAKNGREYLDVPIMDSTKTVDMRVWDMVKKAKEKFKPGSIWNMNIKKSSWNGNPQITFVPGESSMMAESVGEVRDENLLTRVTKIYPYPDLNLVTFIVEMIGYGQNELFKAIYKELFKADPPCAEDIEDITKTDSSYATFEEILGILDKNGRLGLLKDFAYAPAAKNNHGAYIHGLLAHSVEMLKISRDIENNFFTNTAYKNKKMLGGDVKVLDFDAIGFMCLIHDFYKISEYTWDEVGNIDYVESPDVFGHDLKLAFKIINFKEDERFQDELTIKKIERMAFMAAQHHGEWSEFKPSKMRETHKEGELFHLIDMLESRLVSYIEE